MEIPFVSKNPYNNELYRVFEFEETAVIYQKIEAAEKAFKSWKKTSVETRAALFGKLAVMLREQSLQLGVIISEEMGKPIDQAVAEVVKSAWVCDYYAAHAGAFLKPESVFDEGKEQGKIIFEPLGVILQIMPWNFPFWQVFRCTSATLMAGNVSILKHAPNVPRCSEAIVRLFETAGFEKGVFQQIFAATADIAKIMEHDAIKGVALTGSVRAGAAVGQLASKNIKPAVLELGGSDAFIVLEDADLEAAAKTGAVSRFGNNGQTCIAAKRFIVQESVADKFLSLLKNEITAMEQGDPLKKGVQLSVMARPDLAAELQLQLDKSLAAGAEMILKGGLIREGSGFFNPVILTGIPKDCPAYREELFGPVLSLFTVKDEAEAITMANDSIYGLGASVWTSDSEKAMELAASLEVGAVSINQLVRSAPYMPFGGIKKSGYGRELGKEGIRSFVNVKGVLF